MVLAGCFSVSIIHQILTRTTGSLTRAQILKHAIAHGGVRTHVRESALKVDSGRKIHCRTRESNLRQQRDSPMLYQWATSLPIFSVLHCLIKTAFYWTFCVFWSSFGPLVLRSVPRSIVIECQCKTAHVQPQLRVHIEQQLARRSTDRTINMKVHSIIFVWEKKAEGGGDSDQRRRREEEEERMKSEINIRNKTCKHVIFLSW